MLNWEIIISAAQCTGLCFGFNKKPKLSIGENGVESMNTSLKLSYFGSAVLGNVVKTSVSLGNMLSPNQLLVTSERERDIIRVSGTILESSLKYNFL